MMPTEVIMAIAVESAPISTEVRRKDAARLRDASIASTPNMRRSSPDEIEAIALTSAGIAKADAAIKSEAARYPNRGLDWTGGTRDAMAPRRASAPAIPKW